MSTTEFSATKVCSPPSPGPVFSKDAKISSPSSLSDINVVTWNIAAVNNNPFEYWITPPAGKNGASYSKLMQDVETFVLNPGKEDVAISTVFTDSMLEDLMRDMKRVGWDSLDEVRKVWTKDLRNRRIVSQFLCDDAIGKKRLTSMPDRLTNTIGTADKGNVCRPTLINCYAPRLDSVAQWWKLWREFVFDPVGLLLETGKMKSAPPADAVAPPTPPTRTPVWTLFKTIKRSKYPALTELEEKISVPLQTLCLAIFDAVLVHMINRIAAPVTWHPIKMEMAKALNMNKNRRTVEILETSYANADVIFLQEVSTIFLVEARASKHISETFDFILPPKMNRRDQNSVIMIRKSRFVAERDATHDAIAALKSFAAVAPIDDGDIVAALVSIRGRSAVSEGGGKKKKDLLSTTTTSSSQDGNLLLCSFHGDTNGLATIPVLRATHKVAKMQRRGLLFGLDANTHTSSIDTKKKQDVASFCKAFESLGLASCWGKGPIRKTTFNARTFLQPQLNKSIKSCEMAKAKRDPSFAECHWIDRNPKDFILFESGAFVAKGTDCDNIGDGTGPGAVSYSENRPIPTIEFPSDHAIVVTTLQQFDNPPSSVGGVGAGL